MISLCTSWHKLSPPYHEPGMTGEGMRMQAIFVGEFFPNLMEGRMTFIRPAFSILRTIRDPLGADLYTPPLHEMLVSGGEDSRSGIHFPFSSPLPLPDAPRDCGRHRADFLGGLGKTDLDNVWLSTMCGSRLPPYQCQMLGSSDQPTELF